MKNKKTALMHKYHPGGYIGWGIAILLLMAIAIGVTMYIVNENKSFEGEIAKLTEGNQGEAERTKIRSFAGRLAGIKDEITALKWISYSLDQAVTIKYPLGYHALSQDYFEPYGREVILSKKPIEFVEGELDNIDYITIATRLIVDETSDDISSDFFIEEYLEDLNNRESDTYKSASGLTYTHITGDQKIASELDQPTDIYSLLYRDQEQQLHHLLILSVEKVNEPVLQDFVDQITLPSNFIEVSPTQETK